MDGDHPSQMDAGATSNSGSTLVGSVNMGGAGGVCAASPVWVT